MKNHTAFLSFIALCLLVLFSITSVNLEPEHCEETFSTENESVLAVEKWDVSASDDSQNSQNSQESHTCSDCDCCLHLVNFAVASNIHSTHFFNEYTLMRYFQQNQIVLSYFSEIWKPPRV